MKMICIGEHANHQSCQTLEQLRTTESKSVVRNLKEQVITTGDKALYVTRRMHCKIFNY